MGAAALPMVAMGLSAGGKIFGGISEAKGLRRGAKADEENARLTELQSSIDATDVRRDERMQAGDMLAGFGDSGVEIGSGSAFDLVMQSAFNRDRDIAALKYEAAGTARNYRAEAKNKRKAAKNAIIGSLFSAASSAISSVSGMASGGDASAIAASERNYMLGGSIRLNKRAATGMRRGASGYAG
jgi:hypothetical protein